MSGINKKIIEFLMGVSIFFAVLNVLGFIFFYVCFNKLKPNTNNKEWKKKVYNITLDMIAITFIFAPIYVFTSFGFGKLSVDPRIENCSTIFLLFFALMFIASFIFFFVLYGVRQKYYERLHVLEDKYSYFAKNTEEGKKLTKIIKLYTIALYIYGILLFTQFWLLTKNCKIDNF
jgi:uncharacterized membrane protein